MVKVEKRSDLKPETFYWLKDTTGKAHDKFLVCQTQFVMDDDWVEGSDDYPDGIGFHILGYIDQLRYWDDWVARGYEFYEAVLP